MIQLELHTDTYSYNYIQIFLVIFNYIQIFGGGGERHTVEEKSFRAARPLQVSIDLSIDYKSIVGGEKT